MNSEEIIELLKNNDSKQNVISTLTQIEDPEILQEIIRLFDDEKIEIRGEVFSTLFLNQHDISKQLIWGLAHKSKNVRANVTLVLANRNEKKVIQEILRLTKDSSGLVRTCAYGALGHLECKEGVKELHEGIFDSNIEAVKSAAYALARIGEKISDKEIEVLDKLDESEFRKILKFFN